MAVYAVGDIQGCFSSLKQVLNKLDFDPSKDVLWCVGDLVNRGPDSLKTLRYLKSLGNACICVLGNHDLHLLKCMAGGKKMHRYNNAFTEIRHAPDRKELIDWLRSRPLIHLDQSLGFCMVHAGLHPQWSLRKTIKKAEKVQRRLRSKKWKSFCKTMENYSFSGKENNEKQDRIMFTTAVLTLTRCCTRDGLFDWQRTSNHPAAREQKPWFKHRHAAWKKAGYKIVFGHWAARGLINEERHVLGLDTGCVWGGSLTVARLDSQKVKLISVSCPEYQKIS